MVGTPAERSLSLTCSVAVNLWGISRGILGFGWRGYASTQVQSFFGHYSACEGLLAAEKQGDVGRDPRAPRSFSPPIIGMSNGR